MNQVAYGLKHTFSAGDEIVITEMEHHSNMLIWIELAKELQLVLKVIPLTDSFELDYAKVEELITSKTKLVAFSHMSNVLGTINDVKKLSLLAHSHGALTLIDGCQGIVHTQVDVKELDCDFYVFSAHKLYGPTGVGVLYGKDLSILKPMFYGGGQIQSVALNLGLKQKSEPKKSTFEVKYLDAPYHLESGTPNIADIIAFTSALKYLKEIDSKKLHEWDLELGNYFLHKVKELGDDFVLYGKKSMDKRGNVFAFRYLDTHPSDICTFLDQFGIATRGGLHCAQPLHDALGVSGTIRVSFCFYNTKIEIDYFIECMKKIKNMF
jgi:cysteine desulfurase/selenocysteine lyase